MLGLARDLARGAVDSVGDEDCRGECGCKGDEGLGGEEAVQEADFTDRGLEMLGNPDAQNNHVNDFYIQEMRRQ